MYNKKINKKINLLLNEVSGTDTPPSEGVYIPPTPAYAIPSIGAPGVPSGTPRYSPPPYIPTPGSPPEMWGDPEWWTWFLLDIASLPLSGTSDIVLGSMQRTLDEIEDFQTEEDEIYRGRIRPRSSGEDDNGFDIYPGFPQPTRIPKHLIPNIPKWGEPGWQNYFQIGGSWWYCPHHSPNNPNHGTP